MPGKPTGRFDPNITVRTLLATLGPEGRKVPPPQRLRLAYDLFRVLDRHLRSGGELPDRWAHPEIHCPCCDTTIRYRMHD